MPRFVRSLFAVGLMVSVAGMSYAAAPVNPRAISGATAAPAASATARPGTTSAAPAPVASRSAITQAAQGVAVRSAIPQVATTVAARAAIVPNQKVINAGTTVTGAVSAATVVDQACRDKYFGCMDSFCMSDTNNGGRCLCSNQKATLDKILTQIQEADSQSYKLATEGVEKVQLGAQADYVFQQQAAADKAASAPKKTTGPALDLTQWNTDFVDTSSLFGAGGDVNALADKTGDDLHAAADALCVPAMAGCERDLALIQTMYSSTIQSDCRAYNNYLTQQQQASAQKLAAAQKAIRDAALESFQNSNKYDLGQCTVAFKQCMITTAGCGADFTGCVGVAAASNAANTMGMNSAQMTSIKGALSSIQIAKSTYDSLAAKRVLCDNVTNNCVAVVQQDKDAVWRAFLAEAAPAVKSAELTAESNIRMSCIGNISACFQKGCKDTIDPNNPDGSFDMCITRPEAMFNICKIPLNACGIQSIPSASQLNQAAATNSAAQIWGFVLARLAAMRVDACTMDVKNCLTSPDRCGKDYTQCIGLDTDTIIHMCPSDKLVSCSYQYSAGGQKTSISGDAVYDALSKMVQGIMLGIDNNMLSACQTAANTAMTTVCGGTEECNQLAVDDGVGSRGLKYQVCTDDRSKTCVDDIAQISDDYLKAGGGLMLKISGIMYWENITFNATTGKLEDSTSTTDVDADVAGREMQLVENSINAAIHTIEADPKVQFCITGRQVQGMRTGTGSGSGIGAAAAKSGATNYIGSTDGDAARFPNLTAQMRMIIAQYAIKVAKANYYKKYDELSKRMLADYATIGGRQAAILDARNKDIRREFARRACMGLAAGSILPTSPEPPKNPFGKVLAVTVIAAGVVAMAVPGLNLAVAGTAASMSTGILGTTFTAGTAAGLTGAGMAAAGGVGGIAAIGLLGNSGSANGTENNITDDSWNVCLVGPSRTTADRTTANETASDRTGANQTDDNKTDDNKGGGLMSSQQLNQWNYKSTVTTTFNCDTMVCHRCTESQQCTKTGDPLFGHKYCKTWADPVNTCDDTQF
ncbi:MAG: hypothetical protein FWC51_02340 [Proteobacteria bacterium]|nr:hypothetical protein [Pseudomonadota bacterium]